MKTILITGCSSGFGLETAKHFLDRGWKVIATMRTPNEEVLPRSEHLRVLPLDVTKQQSIEALVEAAGPIDVLVNNAGIGFAGAVEAMSMDSIREIFETNTFGLIALTQAFLPQFRQRQSGVVVNVTSTVTLRALPLLAVYTASKAAVNAFSASLALELEPFNVQVRVVLPGRSPTTRFGDNAKARMPKDFPAEYRDFAAPIFKAMREDTSAVTYAEDVAEGVWRAATDPTCPSMLPAGEDAVEWARAAAVA